MDFADWCDARIYLNLSRPSMFFCGAEAFILSTLDLCAIKHAHAGTAPPQQGAALLHRLGLLHGNSVVYPESITDELIATLTEVALEHGYDAHDFAARDVDWAKHFFSCATCRSPNTGPGGAGCEEGSAIYAQTAGGRFNLVKLT